MCIRDRNDETALKTKYVAATNHYLESWGDYELTYKDFSLAQPVIKTLFDTKQFEELLLKWTDNKSTIHDYIKSNWIENILNTYSWKKALHDGILVQSSSKISKDIIIERASNFTHYKHTFEIITEEDLNLYFELIPSSLFGSDFIFIQRKIFGLILFFRAIGAKLPLLKILKQQSKYI